MKQITPYLWFDTQAKEAVAFYASLFPGSRVLESVSIPTPNRDTDVISFELAGHPFMAINAGPTFQFNPSISFMVNFDPSRHPHAREHLDSTWERLLKRGKALMPLDRYQFSERYGWVQDQFGVSWQLILTDPAGEPRPFIVPSLMFTGDVAGKAEEATDLYISVFKGSRRGTMARYPAGMGPDEEGTVMFTDFMLNGQWFAAMDSAHMHDFGFNEAISLLIPCEDQTEIDHYWARLSHDLQAEQCGWCKDRYGVSWQVWPTVMGEMMAKGSRDQLVRLTEALLPMKKFDIERLKAAYEGR